MSRSATSGIGLARNAPSSARLRRCDLFGLVLGAVLLAVLMLSSVVLVSKQHVERRESLSTRFSVHATLAASFVTEYVSDLADRQVFRATRDLREPADRRTAFESTADVFDTDAALLLDSTGHVLEVLPRRADVIGTVLTDTYGHLATAVNGGIGVSDVVASAAVGVPVVAVAVPFSSAEGRQVFSTTMTVEHTPLGAFFDSAVPVVGGRAYLIDSGGKVFVSGTSPSTGNGSTQELTADQLAAFEQTFGTMTFDGTSYAYARAAVAGTPWHVVLTSRAATLYAPADRGSSHTRLLRLALGAGCVVGLFLLYRLARSRAVAHVLAAAHGEQAMMLHSIISNSHSLIYVKDLEGRYMLANPAFERAFAVAEDDLLGQTDDYLDAALVPTWRANDMRARQGLYEVEETSEAAGGQQLYESLKFPLVDRDGKVYATCGISLDVTSRREFIQATERARDAALGAVSGQRNMAAAASHELRTPTAAILGYLDEVLDSDDLAAEDRDLLAVVHRNARRLNELIDDLLVLERADVSATVMHPAPTSLRTIVDDVMLTFRNAAHQSRIDLTIDAPDELPLVLADSARTEQAIANIVSNALKFTPAGGTVCVTLRARTTPASIGDIDAVEVAVVDTGVGIEPGDLTRVFDRFYRTRTALDLAVKGTGLGLSIAKSMIEAQGGQISVSSLKGQGTTFTVTLPIAVLGDRSQGELVSHVALVVGECVDPR